MTSSTASTACSAPWWECPRRQSKNAKSNGSPSGKENGRKREASVGSPSVGHSIAAASLEVEKRCGHCGKKARWTTKLLFRNKNGTEGAHFAEVCDDHALAFAHEHGIDPPVELRET